ncbi:MAG: RsbRD N-terminal domain-containing protein [Deltaproteobacteria bacterium]|nr:RsbRD N-terminal domain-containing protein [Deltaproteobacteria bacterium]
MELSEFLAKKKGPVLDAWISAIVATYPEQTAQFLRRKKDRFLNPVGHTIQNETDNILEQLLLDEPDFEALTGFLDKLIRIRAIQDFTPAQALDFVFALKPIIRELVEKAGMTDDLARQVLAMERRVDQLALLSFNIYMACREQIYQIRSKELANNTYMALRRAGVVMPGEDAAELEEDSEDNNGLT